MEKTHQPPLKLPFKEMIKSIPGIFGIRLEDEPAFEVIKHTSNFELRHYEKMLLAEVKLAGTHNAAVDQGFEILARYIFGNNTGTEVVSMTTPVFQEKVGEVLEMTTPVYQEKSNQAWVISFVMPARFTLKTLPKPKDGRIRLREKPAQTFAVYRFSGNNTLEAMKTAEEKLRAWLQEEGLPPNTEARFAQYDQPFAVPFLKRNEVLIGVAAE